MLRFVVLQTLTGDGSMDMGKQYVDLALGTLCLGIHLFQWWDAMNQDNRPHGIAFKNIKGGVIRDMKLWKVPNCGSLRRF